MYIDIPEYNDEKKKYIIPYCVKVPSRSDHQLKGKNKATEVSANIAIPYRVLMESFFLISANIMTLPRIPIFNEKRIRERIG